MASDAGHIMGDPDRLRQVVWNLLANAIKFTPAGGRVQIECRRTGHEIEMVVRDTGRGIAPAILPYVFDRFRQADSTSTREYGGLGLGLALVRHLVELHGGTVTAASAGEGQGATFVVRLPAGATDAATGGDGAAGSSLEAVRILVLDDTEEGQKLLATILRSAGGTVKTCASAAEGIAAVSAFRPHVIVADIGMPHDDGYAFVRTLRSLPAEQGGLIPAAALTPTGHADEAHHALQSGFQTYVPKPVEPGQLVAAVTTLASDGRSRRAEA